MSVPLVAAIRVPRLGPGRPWVHPEAVIPDGAYLAYGHRARLRGRGIAAVSRTDSQHPADGDTATGGVAVGAGPECRGGLLALIGQ